MVTVAFMNNGGRTVEKCHQGKLYVFPAGVERQYVMSSIDVARSFAKSVERSYPAIKVSFEENTEGEKSPSDAGERVAYEKFLQKVTNKKQSAAGWWSITVEGIDEPIKVQAGKDNEEKALKEAFAEYEKVGADE